MNVYVAELIGTMLLILLGNGVVAGVLLKESKAENGGWLIITLAWGLAVSMAIYAVDNASGAHLNPAVTLGFAAIGEISWNLVPGYLLAQLVGAFIGAKLVWVLFLPHWKITEDANLKMACFCTAPAIRNTWSNIVSEMLGTFVLLLGLMFIGANEFAEGINPLIVGLLILSIGLSLGGTTGYAINPARDLGPRIAHALLPIAGKRKSDWAYGWIPVVGPIIGGVYGTVFYRGIFLNDFDFIFWAMSFLFCLIITIAIIKQLKIDKA